MNANDKEVYGYKDGRKNGCKDRRKDSWINKEERKEGRAYTGPLGEQTRG